MPDYGKYSEAPIIVNVRGIKELQDYLKTIPKGATKPALEAAAKYIMGDNYHGLKYEPPRVQHGPGNTYKWQSERQRRAYFATDGFGGGIPSKRTHELRDGWQIIMKMAGYQIQLINRVPYADFVQGVIQQRGHYADKWRKARDIVRTNLKGAIKAAQKAVDEFVKGKK